MTTVVNLDIKNTALKIKKKKMVSLFAKIIIDYTLQNVNQINRNGTD